MAAINHESGNSDCLVTFQPTGRRVEVETGTTLLEAGRRAGLLLSAACGGVGVCGKCCVEILSGDLFPTEHEEREFLSSKGYPPRARLACEARVASSVVVSIPVGSFIVGQRLQVDAQDLSIECDPLVESHVMKLAAHSLGDCRSSYARVSDALASCTGEIDWTMRLGVSRQLAPIIQDDCTVSVYTRGTEIIGFASPGRTPVGLAVDVGCTKIAAYLLKLDTGNQLAAAAVPNPQIPYGEDLITRLVYADRSRSHAKTLASVVGQTIESLAKNLCQDAKVELTEIADVCVVGNTAMMHLLLQLPVTQLLRAPFVAALDCGIDVSAGELDWPFAPGANVHVLPSIGGFVGADHVAMILARIDGTNKTTIGIDIGTNTEIVLRNPKRQRFLTTSVPSGPVFEGGHISDGMRAASGAIDRVFIADAELCYATIDAADPVGICGSGVLDVVAALLRLDVIDLRGHMQRRHPRVRSGKCGLEYLVVPAAETGHGRDIVLTQQDITQIQLAKAAICAGIETLMDSEGIKPLDVEQVIVAGAFGSYLDLKSAIDIGMLPRFPNAQYLQVGNAAGAGAKMCLVSRSARERARIIAKAATRIELKKCAGFDGAMARATRFPKFQHSNS